ncbi:MAG TPA: hypothetical protein VJ768_03320, partial [Anaerolineales bacterium]|nr:hypothetical protein [Anaerolineales bacterium]
MGQLLLPDLSEVLNRPEKQLSKFPERSGDSGVTAVAADGGMAFSQPPGGILELISFGLLADFYPLSTIYFYRRRVNVRGLAGHALAPSPGFVLPVPLRS